MNPVAREFKIADRTVGPSQRPLIIAEMSGNHNQSLERALQIVDAAAKAGADALKIQTYTADTMTLDLHRGEFQIDDDSSLWDGNTLYDLYKQAHTPWDWHPTILERARARGLICFSTPFDASAVEYLETLEVPAYKIASFENTDIPLIKKVAATGKPMIISTGMATAEELSETVEAAHANGCRDLVLLKCTSTYPASPENTNILTIPDMRERFGLQIGLSDHTLGIGVSVASVALGATVIEKHFTLARSDGGVDSAFSLEPSELKALVVESTRAWQAMGQVKYGTSEQEKRSIRFKRSLYVVEDMKKGDRLTEKNLRNIRPGLGLPPKYLDELVGRSVSRDINRGTALKWDLIESD